MSEKNIKSRIIHKHDTEANWIKATGFIPKQAEIIIYDKDSTHAYERFKIGDGVTNVNSLPFADDTKVDKVSGKGLSTNDYTTDEKNKLAGIAAGATKVIIDSSLSATSTNPVQNKVVNTAISNLNMLVGDTSVAEQIATATEGTIKVTVVNADYNMTAADVCNLPTGWYLFAFTFQYTDERGTYHKIEDFARIDHFDESTGPQAYIYNYGKGWFYLLRQDDGLYHWDICQSLDGTSNDIYFLEKDVAKKLDASDATWTQIYDSGEITSEVNSISGIDIAGYKSLMVAVKCVNTTNTTSTRAGAVIFSGNNQDYAFNNIFSNLLKKDTTISGAMAKFRIVDGFIICESAMRAINADGILSDIEGEGFDLMASVGGGLIKCTNTVTTMTVSSAAQSAEHYYGVGSRVIVWGCKI